MLNELNNITVGFEGFSIKKSNAHGKLYHIRYAGHPVIRPFELSLGYKVQISCTGHEKTYPHFTFKLEFSRSESHVTMFGTGSSDRKVDLFDGTHDEFLQDEVYKRLTEVVRIWSLELNSKFADDFDDEYSFTGNILITSSDQNIPIKDFTNILSKFDFTKYTPDECNEFCKSIKEVRIDELLLQLQQEDPIRGFELMLEQKVDSEK